MSSPKSTWSDRRGLFQNGKEVHEPALRRASQEDSRVVDAVRRTSMAGSNKFEKPVLDNPSPVQDTARRRRSSAASQGLFANLSHHKRGSEDYAERRASHHDQASAGGAVSSWWNSTFRGSNDLFGQCSRPLDFWKVKYRDKVLNHHVHEAEGCAFHHFIELELALQCLGDPATRGDREHPYQQIPPVSAYRKGMDGASSSTEETGETAVNDAQSKSISVALRAHAAIPCNAQNNEHGSWSRNSSMPLVTPHTAIESTAENTSERKIDLISDRLASIEHLIRNGSTFMRPSPASDAVANAPEAINQENQDEQSPVVPSIGYTGPNAETLAAKNVLEQTMENNPVVQQDQQLRTALASLHNIVGRLDVEGEALTDHYDPSDLKNVALPLRKQISQELYERPESNSQIRRLLVYAGLFAACTELSAVSSGDDPAHYYDLMTIFQQRVMGAVRSLPLLIPPTKEAADALFGRSGVCQTLGYNRLPPASLESAEERQQKLALFWMVYVMDRSNSLRLGRAPAIHDSYISSPKPSPSKQFTNSFIHLIRFWIDVASVQGRICEQLYSPVALAQVSSERQNVSESLAMELQQIYKTRLAVSVRNAPETLELILSQAEEEILPLLEKSMGDLAHLIAGGDNIVFYSVFSLPLVGDAWSAIRSPHELQSLTYRRVVLNTPLTPFTVLFCHIIANHHEVQDDLDLIRDYVVSLRPACQLSDGIEKFYRMCSVFWKVAEAYVSAKLSEEASRLKNVSPTTQNLESVMGEFDGYLSSLGFAPVPPELEVESATSGAAASDMSSYLYDWYSGNASLYGLLEQNFEGIDLPLVDSPSQRPGFYTMASTADLSSYTILQADGLYPDDAIEQQTFAPAQGQKYSLTYLQSDLWPSNAITPKPWSSIPEDVRLKVNGIMLLKLAFTSDDLELFPALRV
nr:hypothetical protein CFP56_73187 [Quercus suber]